MAKTVSKDPAPKFYVREGRWREPVPGEIIYLPGSTVPHKCTKNGDVLMRAGQDSKGRERWLVRFFGDRTLAAMGQRKLPGFGLVAYSLREPQYTRRKRAH